MILTEYGYPEFYPGYRYLAFARVEHAHARFGYEEAVLHAGQTRALFIRASCLLAGENSRLFSQGNCHCEST